MNMIGHESVSNFWYAGGSPDALFAALLLTNLFRLAVSRFGLWWDLFRPHQRKGVSNSRTCDSFGKIELGTTMAVGAERKDKRLFAFVVCSVENLGVDGWREHNCPGFFSCLVNGFMELTRGRSVPHLKHYHALLHLFIRSSIFV